jgi:3-oxoacyl-[acyl-carrier protein] reductase
MVMSEPRVALIAGGSGAIGGTTAERLAREGYDVALVYRSNTDAAETYAEQVRAAGQTARLYRAALEEYDQVAAAVDAAVGDFGRLDATIYAAGPYIPQKWVTEFPPEMMHDVIRQDTFGAWNSFHASLLHLRETKGCIVSVSTPAVKRHARKDLLSSAPKAAIEAMIRAIASEEGRYGVRANAVQVGTVEDGLFNKLRDGNEFDPHWIEVSLKLISLGRFGRATDIAEAITFLASPERAGYITGQTLTVDGGYAL